MEHLDVWSADPGRRRLGHPRYDACGPAKPGPYADAGEILTGIGLRRTLPRLRILAVLCETATHLSVSHLHRLVADAHPKVDLSTVYRNVTMMREHGVLHSFTHAGEAMFGLATTPHHHLFCERCGLLVEVPADRLGTAAELIKSSCGFEVEPSGQFLRGRCGGCRQASRNAG
ncbi:Fur family transcriptional regulator [Spongiactinospora rosea]|nr:transcriptional repressor [Spongiactinospora rosea]